VIVNVAAHGSQVSVSMSPTLMVMSTEGGTTRVHAPEGARDVPQLYPIE
jgi:hypothetical protein